MTYFRGSVVQLTIFGLILYFLISITSATGNTSNVASFVLQNSYREGHGDTYYKGHVNHAKILRRSSSSESPTSDDDYHREGRRGVSDHHGRTLIFKSLILVPLAMVVFIIFVILLFPIPVISQAIPNGRAIESPSFISSTISSSKHTLQLARDALTAEECIERVSCELTRLSRSYDSTSWIPSTLEKLLVKNKWSERIVRGIKGTTPVACSQFKCTPAKNLKRTLKLKSDVIAQ